MSSEEEILALEDRGFDAMIKGDFGALDAKKSWIESMKSGKTRYKSAQPRSLRLLFLNAWVRTPRGWRFAAWQSCPQPA